MQRYRRYGPKITKIASILLAICIGFTAFVMVEIFALNSDHNSLESLYGRALSDLSCIQLCPALPSEQSGTCCEPLLTVCQLKSGCYQSKISEYQALINQETDYIDYFSIPAAFFFVSFLIAVIYYVRLKKKCQYQERLYAFQEELLANQDNNGMGFDDESQEFQNYNAFIQYMIEHGYLYQIPSNQKKGDSKITQSFGTNDDTVCPICMMEYREEKVLKLRCNHKFHSSCIRDWNQANSSCPVCRGDIYQ